MLTQTIQRHSPIVIPGKGRLMKKLKVVAGSSAHRELIFNRTWADVEANRKLEIGRHVCVHGFKKEKCQIINFEHDISKVSWEGLKVRFIEVYVPSADEIFMCHPSDLTPI
jgi:hypothetical protein